MAYSLGIIDLVFREIVHFLICRKLDSWICCSLQKGRHFGHGIVPDCRHILIIGLSDIGDYPLGLSHLIRHSRLPAGNALWVCQNFFFFFFLFFRRQGFRMITFDRQAGPLQNFNRSHIMVIGRSVLFSDPARPPGGGVGRPKHPKIPPPPEK